jgi:hypothetical protein
VDQEGNILNILVQRRQDKHAAKKFFSKLLKGLTCVPRVIITDQLQSCGAAKREMLPSVEPRQYRYLNNRAENPPPTDAPAGTTDAAVQIPRAGATLLGGVWPYLLALPSSTPAATCFRVPPSHGPKIPDRVGDHGHGDGRV